ncbi:MAG: beta-N-acetylhexosaminidase [Chloroflexi bacterium]|nr:beta-N-acetylhexosaminidase [Chloroflexota bacterium]
MPEITLFPQPQQLERQPGAFTLNAHTRLFAANRALGEMLANYLRPATGFGLPVHPLDEDILADTTNAILLVPSPDLVDAEAYKLNVRPERVTLRAGGRSGFLYAMQTLRQLMPPQILADSLQDGIAWEIAALSITDAPAFGWRGLHLDVGRHMFPVDFIKKFIDTMALYKFNTFHWHLTEDQGWRLEIEKYPRLTEIGSQRAESPIPADPKRTDGKPYGGYYTQDEARQIVAYAAERGITIMPEIELPGHSLAALTAYPQLGCLGGGYEVRRTWGIDSNIYCAGNDAVFEFLQDVFEEVLALFPSTYIHIGGDEAPKERWRSCPKCQARIEAEGLADEDELQSWFIRQIESWLNERGRRLVGWDEILEGGLAPNATVMSWRGSDGGIAAANAGHDVIMTPTTYCYLDYYQHEDWTREPPAIARTLTLEQAWQFVVVPEEIAPDKKHHILGGQGNIWTEYIPSADQVEYMAFPRAIAIADVLWKHPEDRHYAALLARLKAHLPCLDFLGLNYRHLDD